MTPALLLPALIESVSAEVEKQPSLKPNFDTKLAADQIWKQKIFCILSSQFNATRAAVIANRLLEEIPFFERSFALGEIESACFDLLIAPSVGYRFPRIRAQQISLCWFPFLQIKDEYHQYIGSFSSEDGARAGIIGTFPGIGIKQASMLMRNIGASKTLAIIDVHILYYLSVCHGWQLDATLSQKRYLAAEEIMRYEAARRGLDLNLFDTVVWTSVKALKGATAHV
jgi:N-glycosylase/DNA lyase